MSSGPVPIYSEHGKTYHADSCEPLLAAVQRGELTLEALARANYPGWPLKPGTLPGLCSVGYWDARQEQNWGLPWHRNEGIELTFLETGSMPFALGDQSWELAPGTLTITRPWQPHKVGRPNIGIGRLHWIIIDVEVRQPHQVWQWPPWLVITPDDLEELTGFLRENEQAVWTSSPDIQHCFQHIGQSVRDHSDHGSRLAVYINELLLHLLDLFHRQQAPRTKSLTDAQRSVELFLSTLQSSLEETWTLETMADCCGLGVTRFVHYCRRITNLTPMQYLNRLRVKAAAEALRQSPDTSVTEIALACGFSTSQYFATVFRKEFGCSPRQYRTASSTIATGPTRPSSPCAEPAGSG